MTTRLNLRHLRAVASVIEMQSIAKASEQLLRAPSAVARSLKELEGWLAVDLFHRSSRGVTPNDFGRVVYEAARRVEAELALCNTEMAAFNASKGAALFAMMSGYRQLEILSKILALGHMPSVATSLGISQPAVSAALKSMESSLSIQLFRRSRDGLRATDAGERLIYRVRRVLTELRHLESDISQLRGSIAGSVTIAALPSSKTVLLPLAIAQLVTRYPQIEVSVVDAPYESLFADVQSGEIDLIFTSISPDYLMKDLRIEPVGRESLILVARAGHPLARKRDLAPEDLSDYPWILRDASSPSRKLIRDGLARSGIATPRVSVQASDLGILRGLLLSTDFISAVSPEQLFYELSRGEVVKLPIELPWSEREIGFVLRKDRNPSALCTLLMNEIRAMKAA